MSEYLRSVKNDLGNVNDGLVFEFMSRHDVVVVLFCRNLEMGHPVILGTRELLEFSRSQPRLPKTYKDPATLGDASEILQGSFR